MARSGQESLAQGLPGVYPGLVKNKRSALKLKGLEMRAFRFKRPKLGPFRANFWEEFPRVNSGLCFFGHFGAIDGEFRLNSHSLALAKPVRDFQFAPGL
jgi:hypothetical protein